MPVKCILSIGTNIEDRKQNLIKALQTITNDLGEIIKVSSIYETEPWGFHAPVNFYNQALTVLTEHKPLELLQVCKSIERAFGRRKVSTNYESRPIDIDILFYGQEFFHKPDLIVPHPKLHLRNFVLFPLNEIEPEFFHPLLKKKIKELFSMCPDKNWIKKISPST